MKIDRKNHVNRINFKIPDDLMKYEEYPKIINYVSTVNLGLKFDLNQLSLYIGSADRKPRRFAAITLRIKPTTCLLFSTGNIVISGARTENESKLAAHNYRLFLEKIPQVFYDIEKKKFFYDTLEKHIKFQNFEIRNVVGCGKLFNYPNESLDNNNTLLTNEFMINLDSFAKHNIINAGWDREIFPGMRFNIEKSEECPINVDSIMAHIFEARKYVLMGSKCKEDIYIGHNYLKKIVSPYLNTFKDEKEPLFNKLENIFKNVKFIKINSKNEKKKNIPNKIPQEEEEEEEKEEEKKKEILNNNLKNKKNDNNLDNEYDNDKYELMMEQIFDHLKTKDQNLIIPNNRMDEEELKNDTIMQEIEEEFDFFY